MQLKRTILKTFKAEDSKKLTKGNDSEVYKEDIMIKI